MATSKIVLVAIFRPSLYISSMKNLTSFRPYFILSVLFGLIFFAGCADMYNPGYSSPSSGYGGYNSPYDSGYDHRDDYYRQRELDASRHERRELERERERAEQERERLAAERREASRNRPPPPQEHCPSGYSPRERSCSPDERKHGCSDIRLSSGMGCVRR